MAKNFISNKDQTVVMFKSPFLEKLSRIHWSIPLFLYVPVVLFFLYKTFFVLKLSIIGAVALYIGGVILWTLTRIYFA